MRNHIIKYKIHNSTSLQYWDSSKRLVKPVLKDRQRICDASSGTSVQATAIAYYQDARLFVNIICRYNIIG